MFKGLTVEDIKFYISGTLFKIHTIFILYIFYLYTFSFSSSRWRQILTGKSLPTSRIFD